MPIPDKVAAAKQIDALLKDLLRTGGFRLKYRIVVNPPVADNRDWEHPDILVDFAGPDSGLLLDRGGEVLRSFEHVAHKMLRLDSEEHEKVSFDCNNFKAMRLEELRLAAEVAAEKVAKTGVPYTFAPMSARERRIVHLALRDNPQLKTESTGEGLRRSVVVYPKDYKPKASSKAAPRVLP
jgi:spoIIIJ-associated protein